MTKKPTFNDLLRDRILKYLGALPDAVAGKSGHKATYYAARVLVWGFCLPRDEALNICASTTAAVRLYGPRRNWLTKSIPLLRAATGAGVPAQKNNHQVTCAATGPNRSSPNEQN